MTLGAELSMAAHYTGRQTGGLSLVPGAKETFHTLLSSISEYYDFNGSAKTTVS